MIDRVKVRLALRNQLLTLVGLPSSRAWEGRSFSPPDPPNTWVRETLLPAIERQAATQLVEGRGFVQYDIFVPNGTGTETAEALQLAVADLFKPGQDVSYGGVSVAIDRVERPNMTITPDKVYMQFPVVVTWRTYVANP